MATLTLSFTCSKCGKENTIVNPEICADLRDCDECGSSGSVYADVQCSSCGKFQKILIKVYGWEGHSKKKWDDRVEEK